MQIAKTIQQMQYTGRSPAACPRFGSDAMAELAAVMTQLAELVSGVGTSTEGLAPLSRRAA
jgi:hypothetical protein